MSTLITTLGRVVATNGKQGQYRTMRYDFTDGYVSNDTPFFGLAFYDYLRHIGVEVERIVILGTAGSMWDAWLEIENVAEDDRSIELCGKLFDAAKNDIEDVALLTELSEVLSDSLNVSVSCEYILYGMSASEQIGILETISKTFPSGGDVYIDVTHGLRHLPMMEMVSAFLMKHIASVCVKGIFYGAAERRNAENVSPVVKLNGLMSVQQGIEAVAIMNQTGNVEQLACLFDDDGSIAESLRQYQFFQQMNNVAHARKVANAVLSNLDCLSVVGKLFEEEVRRHFSWGAGMTYAKRQYEQSLNAYAHGDYLRAVILLTEAVISRVASGLSGDVMSYEVRENAREILNKERDGNWRLLSNMRNALAHGSRAAGNTGKVVEQMRASHEVFRKEMDSLFDYYSEL